MGLGAEAPAPPSSHTTGGPRRFLLLYPGGCGGRPPELLDGCLPHPSFQPGLSASLPSRNEQGRLLRGSLEAQRVGSEAPRKGRSMAGAWQGPGTADSKPNPSTLSRAWRQGSGGAGGGGMREHCTQCPGHTMHKGPAGQAARAHSGQYHLAGPPRAGRRSWTVSWGTVGLYSYLKGECVTLLAVNGGPWRGGGGDRAIAVPRVGSPHGSRL